MFSDLEHDMSQRTVAREAFFIDFAKAVRQNHPSVVLMLTGGFRSVAGMHSALKENACDLIGIARPAVMNPSWAKTILQKEVEGGCAELRLRPADQDFLSRWIPIKLLGAGAETVSFLALWLIEVFLYADEERDRAIMSGK